MKDILGYKCSTQSRSIKFRVWNSFYGKFAHYPDARMLIGLDGKCYSGAGDIYDDGEYIIQQYIGLNDTNGVEIYEGDIVSGYFSTMIGSDNDIPFRYEFSGIVEYDNTEFKCKHADFPLCKYNLTVVGNCFQCSEQYEFHKELGNEHD